MATLEIRISSFIFKTPSLIGSVTIGENCKPTYAKDEDAGKKFEFKS